MFSSIKTYVVCLCVDHVVNRRISKCHEHAYTIYTLFILNQLKIVELRYGVVELVDKAANMLRKAGWAYERKVRTIVCRRRGHFRIKVFIQNG